MRLVAQLKLTPTPAQAEMLAATMAACNAACDWISEQAWEQSRFRQFDLHKLCYREVREKFGLSAQAAVRCIAKVADAYKLSEYPKRVFRPQGAVCFDNRILSYSPGSVSIWTLGGRQRIPFRCGEHQRQMLATQHGETDLVLVRGQWFLLATCVVAEKPAAGSDSAMGVDLGIRNTAATSHGTLHSGATGQQFKEGRHKVRASLQSRNNRRARRVLRRIAGRERRRITWENHNLSKAIVAEAEGTQCGIIRMERLTGIRERCKVPNKHLNRMMSGWSFGQLQAFVAYKAALRGIKVEYVEAAYTSQVCASCGATGSRRGDVFTCATCGTAHADVNAAVSIARGGVARPDRGKPTRRRPRDVRSVSHIAKTKSRRL